MNKEANTDYPIHSLLSKRWSPRAFKSNPLETEKLKRILEAARWSPSASNEQPWYFILGCKDDDTYNNIYECLVEFNQSWAKYAPVLMLSIGRNKSLKTGGINRDFRYDVGQSVAHLNIQAMQENIYVHQMSGFDPEKARSLFKIPDDYNALTALALGYLGDPGMLHPRMQKSEIASRERKPINEFVFSEEFGKASKLIKE